jgi:hypothetical protein
LREREKDEGKDASRNKRRTIIAIKERKKRVSKSGDELRK